MKKTKTKSAICQYILGRHGKVSERKLVMNARSKEFKQMSSTIKTVFVDYEAARTVTHAPQGGNVSDSGAPQRNHQTKLFVLLVDEALNNLDGMDNHIIISEFKEQDAYEIKWWENLISRAHYYRLKRIAMENFIFTCHELGLAI